MTKHTRRVLELGVGLALALAIVLTVGADWHQRTAAQVRADTLRLHILANSDTLDDQLLKLQVRDAVLAALPPAVTKAATPDEAAAALQYALPALQQAADTALHRAHSPGRPPAVGTVGLCRAGLWQLHLAGRGLHSPAH